MLPPLIMTSEPGSFAEQTIRQRKPQIIATVLATNDYAPEIVANLRALAEEIANAPVAPLAVWPADQPWWRTTWAPLEGRSWFDLPWYFAEAYFYRRLLSAVGYNDPRDDPFLPQKRASLPAAIASLGRMAALLGPEQATGEMLQLWLRRSLWGNRADLSNQTVAIDRHHYGGEDDHERLLIDDSAALAAHLLSGWVRRLDLVADNSGPELCADLVLLDFLLRTELVQQIRLHLKSLPFFVSDAMLTDVNATIAALQASDCEPLRALAARLADQIAAGQLDLQAHGAWASPLFFDALPVELYATLGDADLVLFKGDANYRRMVGDRHWPPTTALGDVTAFMPTSFGLLRTLKSELVVGLAPGQAEALAAQDPDWLINGERGVIHLVWRG